jgi:hypothetical protein
MVEAVVGTSMLKRAVDKSPSVVFSWAERKEGGGKLMEHIKNRERRGGG